jgi:hypothetical protein
MLGPRGGGYSISFSDRLHVLFDAADRSLVGSAIVCNSDLEVAAQYAEFTTKAGKPLNGTSCRWPGFHHWRVSSGGSRTYWVTAVSLWYPIVLSGVLPAIWIGRRLWRSRGRFSLRALLFGAFAIAMFFGFWSLTDTVGARDVTDYAVELLSLDGKSRRVDHDPLRDDEIRQCHYAGNAISPLPLIVTVDYGFIAYVGPDGRVGEPKDGHFHGESGRACFLWLFGYMLQLEHWNRPGMVMLGGD